MGVGEISIQLQRVFTFGDAFRGALGQYVDNPNFIWPIAWSGTDDKALVNFASAAAKAACGSVTKKSAPASVSARADPMSASTLLGIGRERAIEKAARLREIVGGPPLLSQAKP